MNDFHKHQYKWRITTTKNAIPADENVLKVIATGTSTLTAGINNIIALHLLFPVYLIINPSLLKNPEFQITQSFPLPSQSGM